MCSKNKIIFKGVAQKKINRPDLVSLLTEQ